MAKKDIFHQLTDHWPSPLVAASQVKRFSGGIVSGKTLANLKSLGKPVPDSVKIGSRRAYVAESLAGWLRNRSKSEVI
ncbi:MAG: hypothetical protein RBR43_06785 [Desulfuromonadaceae bacterium]|nr:hypothetical protein [Desulfuromonadaceae bacterium]